MPELELKPTEEEYKHSYMGEFHCLWIEDGGDELNHPSFHAMQQTAEDIIHVRAGKGLSMYNRLHRLNKFGWVLRWLNYHPDGDLDLYFEKLRPQNYGYYSIDPAKVFKIVKNEDVVL